MITSRKGTVTSLTAAMRTALSTLMFRSPGLVHPNTLAALRRRRLVDGSGQLTEAGRAVVAAMRTTAAEADRQAAEDREPARHAEDDRRAEARAATERAPAADPRYRTADGVLITDGLLAWNYHRRITRVVIRTGEITDPGGQYWDGGFECVDPTTGAPMSTMNGERLITVLDGQLAADLAAAAKPVNLLLVGPAAALAASGYTEPAPAAAPVPYICQLGQPGRFHEMSWRHPRSSGYSQHASAMIEHVTCRCGLDVTRFVFEGQTAFSAHVRLLPTSEWAAVVAGLAPERLGPELPTSSDYWPPARSAVPPLAPGRGSAPALAVRPWLDDRPPIRPRPSAGGWTDQAALPAARTAGEPRRTLVDLADAPTVRII